VDNYKYSSTNWNKLQARYGFKL